MRTNLQKMRKAAGFKSARLFAEHIGMSVSTYTNYEQGRVSMDVELLWRFADAMNCTVDEILGREAPYRDMEDPVHRAIADAYEDMNEHGRKRLAEQAEMMAKSGMFSKDAGYN